ncbi:MAG: hypothetical protein IPM55_23910 [Acidobacteria bacterium]|nr:hypothetical protein [Acidobacteriota bacterium]
MVVCQCRRTWTIESEANRLLRPASRAPDVWRSVSYLSYGADRDASKMALIISTSVGIGDVSAVDTATKKQTQLTRFRRTVSELNRTHPEEFWYTNPTAERFRAG